MSKKNVFIVCICLLCISLMTACRHKEEYVFMHEQQEILSVSIASVCLDENGCCIQTELTKITDLQTFFNNFKQVDCFTHYGDPIGILETERESYVIKVVFQNGDYELIHWSGQAEYSQAKGFRNYVGYSVFDESQFKNLVSKYLWGQG